MKRINYFIGAILLLSLTACGSDGDNNNNASASGGGSNISCAEIAGNFNGINFSENSCDGRNYSGKLSGSITPTCNVNFVSNYGVSVTGTITGKTDNSFFGRGQTSYCGPASLTCANTPSGVGCEYKFDRGGGGVLY